MPQYKIQAEATSAITSLIRKARCTAATPRAAILKLLARYPQLDEHTTLRVTVTVDDEEELS